MAKREAQKLDRKNFIVDGKKKESEAVRVAVDRTLNAEEAVAALERLRKRGSWGKNLAY